MRLFIRPPPSGCSSIGIESISSRLSDFSTKSDEFPINTNKTNIINSRICFVRPVVGDFQFKSTNMESICTNMTTSSYSEESGFQDYEGSTNSSMNTSMTSIMDSSMNINMKGNKNSDMNSNLDSNMNSSKNSNMNSGMDSNMNSSMTSIVVQSPVKEVTEPQSEKEVTPMPFKLKLKEYIFKSQQSKL